MNHLNFTLYQSIISSTELDLFHSIKAFLSMAALVIDASAAGSLAVSDTIHVVQFNPVAQLPLKLQDNLNFSTRKAQLVMLLYQLMGYLDGTITALSPSTTKIVLLYKFQLSNLVLLGSFDPTRNDDID